MARRINWILVAGMAVAFVLLLAACSTTQLKDQWRDPAYRAGVEQKILIVAVTGRDDRRRILEDELSARLRSEGVVALQSYPQLPVIDPQNPDAVRKVVEQNGVTTLLSVRLIRTDLQTDVSDGYHDSYYRFYPYASAGVYAPSVYTYRTYTTETRLFDMRRDKLAWVATLESEEPSDFRAAAQEYADLVVTQMRDNKLIGGG